MSAQEEHVAAQGPGICGEPSADRPAWPLAIGAILSIAAAYAGVHLIRHEQGAAGSALLASAVTLFGTVGWLAPGWRLASAREVKIPAAHRLSLPSLVLLALSLAGTIEALRALVSDPLSARAVGLWAASIVVFLAGLALSSGPPWIGIRIAPQVRRDVVVEGAVVILIIVAGLMLRVWELGTYPTGAHGDEGEFGLEALKILDGTWEPPFTLGFLGHPRADFYLRAAAMGLFGRGLGGLRLVSALSGTAVLACVYGFTRTLFSRRAALLATALVAVSGTDIHFSRLGLNNIQTPLFWVPAFGLLLTGLRSGRPLDFGASGILAGLSLYFYFASRLIPLILVLFLLVLVLTRPRLIQSYLVHILLTVMGAMVAFAPLGWFFVTNPRAFVDRAVSYSIFTNWQTLLAEYHTQNALRILLEQGRRATQVFLTTPDVSTFYPADGPIIDPAVAPLFFAGFALAAGRWRSPRYCLLALWFGLTFLFGAVFSINVPWVPRLIGLMPAVFIFAALALDETLSAVDEWSGRLRRPLSVAACLIAVGWVAWAQTTAYFVRFADSYPWSDSTTQARVIATLQDRYVVYVAGAPHMYFGHGTTRFLAQGVRGGDLVDAARQLPMPLPADKGLVFLVYPHRHDLLPTLHQYYPDAVEVPISDPRGQPLFVAVFAKLVPPL